MHSDVIYLVKKFRYKKESIEICSYMYISFDLFAFSYLKNRVNLSKNSKNYGKIVKIGPFLTIYNSFYFNSPTQKKTQYIRKTIKK